MQTSVSAFVGAHTTVIAVGSMWLFSNIVTALPSPSNSSGGFYKFFFALLHGLSGSLPRVFPQARVFNDPTRGSQTYFAHDGQEQQTASAPPPQGG